MRSSVIRRVSAYHWLRIDSNSAAGYSYHKYYKYLVLEKIDNAFKPGDPALEVAGVDPGKQGRRSLEHWIPRDEQDKMDRIISGETRGHYYLIIGEKGTGKTSMIIEAMRKIQGDGVSMFDAHADLEIFRMRLGKALDYEFHEEYTHLSGLVAIEIDQVV